MVYFQGHEVLLDGATGTYFNKVADIAYANPTDDANPAEPTYKVCVCVPSGKLFIVPNPFRCDQANEETNPCLE